LIDAKISLARKARDVLFFAVSIGATLIGLATLAAILWTLISEGLPGINLKLFTLENPPPPGADGGLANSMVGSLLMIAIAVGVGAPIGVLAGTYLAEYGRYSRLAAVVRALNDILLSAPSIVVGLFIYVFVVAPMTHFSAYAGAAALAVIVIPVVVRTTENMLQLIPDSQREAAAGLGAPPSIVIQKVLWKAAQTGILTGILLSIARISGETAPLLFTALNNNNWSFDLDGPVGSLPVAIFTMALSPYDDWHKLAWAGALVVTFAVLMTNIIARLLVSEHRK